jgi:hypothetical protein
VEPAPAPPLEPPEDRRFAWLGILVGTSVGVGMAFLAWLVFTRVDRALGTVMSFTFIFVVPFVTGFATNVVGDTKGTWRTATRLLVPLLPVLLATGTAFLLGWEGAICIVMLIPAWIPLAMLGGAVGSSQLRNARRAATLKRRRNVLVCALVVPFVVAPVEERLPLPDDLRTVTSSIEIQASPERVWPEIARVRRIDPSEHEFRWVHVIGFPRPVEATLSHEGVGGVRHASFEGGVVFVETVDIWQPGKRLGFSIHADPDSIPAKTLDEHVTVGGPYFDVLHGEYLIEPLPNGRVRLVLTSHHRLSTHFNFYAKWWTDFVMADIQEEILVILKRRCEAPAK